MNFKIIVLLAVASFFSQFLGNLDLSNDSFIVSEIFLFVGIIFIIKYLKQYTFLEIFYFLLASFTHPLIFVIAIICAFPLAFYVETNVHQLNLILFWSIMMLGTYARFYSVEFLMQKLKQSYQKEILWKEFIGHHKILSPFLLLTFAFLFPLEGNVVGFIYFPIGIILSFVLYPMYIVLTLTMYFPKLKEKLAWFIKVQNAVSIVLFIGACIYVIGNQ